MYLVFILMIEQILITEKLGLNVSRNYVIYCGGDLVPNQIDENPSRTLHVQNELNLLLILRIPYHFFIHCVSVWVVL